MSNNSRRNPSGSGRDIYSSSGRRRTSQPSGDIDRYNYYVDRDIYSSSKSYSKNRRKPARKKKRGCGTKLLAGIVCTLFILAAGVAAYSYIMLSRVDRSDNVDSDDMGQYVQQPSGAPSWGIISNNNVFNILLMGIDKNKDGSDGRSDTNILVSINKDSKKIHLVSFMRDTYLDIPTVDKTKFNAAFANGGAALTMQTLENNFRVNIDKYVSVNCDNFEDIIDKMGGIDVEMTKEAARYENKVMGSSLKEGTNHLNGKLCLYYARMRYVTDKDGSNDFGRTARQRQIVSLIISKVKSLNPIKANKIMYDYLPYVKTNLTDSELVYLASIAVTASNYDMDKMQVPAQNAFQSEKINGADVLVPDLEKNCQLLREFLYGSSSSSDES